jgi:uncharacterized protein
LSERDAYPSGVPCWVETLQPDPRAALKFYGQLLGWEFGDPGPMPGALPGEYYVAQVNGRDVAGIGSLPDLGEPAVPLWNTYIRVESADEAVATAQAAGGQLLVGPLDALPAGRLAALIDPMGAAFCVWEARGREGAQLVNEPRAWAMSSLHTTDFERAEAFYGSVFGWHSEAIGPPAAQMTLWRLRGYACEEARQLIPRDVVAVMAPTSDAAAPIPPHWNVNFYVDGVDATVAQAIRLGGRVIVAALDTPGFRSAALADPQGAVFSISQVTVGP